MQQTEDEQAYEHLKTITRNEKAERIKTWQATFLVVACLFCFITKLVGWHVFLCHTNRVAVAQYSPTASFETYYYNKFRHMSTAVIFLSLFPLVIP